MIAACYANPNWDGKDNAEKRKEYLQQLNDHFNQAIDRVHNPQERAAVDVDWDNPFYAAHKREIARTQEAFRLQLGEQGKTAGDVLEAEEQVGGKIASDLRNDNGRGEYDQIMPPE